ncbi:MAG TPA: DedA family protein [Phycisphaerae bacterium]|nr:DedA family protein [Phycisphaerae bacterium]
MTQFLLPLLTHFTYLALSLLMIVAGCGVPIPEDVPLILSGYLCHPKYSPLAGTTVGATNLSLMVLFGMGGIIIGDSILWYVGRYGIDSNNIVARHARKILHTQRRTMVEQYFLKYGTPTLFIGRFIPGVRAIIFALCGISRMPYWKFILVDGLAGFITVSVCIFVGYWQSHNIQQLLEEAAKVKHIIYLVASVGIIAAVAVYYLRQRRRTNRNASNQET